MPTSRDLEGYIETRHEECAEAATLVRRWIDDAINHREPWHLTLLGKSGCGKTHLAAAAKSAIKGARFRRWFRILAAIRDGQPGVPALMESFPVLCIDDIGASYDTDFSKALAVEIAERRLGKFTLWTANGSARGLADTFDARLVSRMKRGNNQIFTFRTCRDFALES